MKMQGGKKSFFQRLIFPLNLDIRDFQPGEHSILILLDRKGISSLNKAFSKTIP